MSTSVSRAMNPLSTVVSLNHRPPLLPNLKPAGEWKFHHFREVMEEGLGIPPRLGGRTVEECPFHAGPERSLEIDWTSCAFACRVCGTRGGLARLVQFLQEQHQLETQANRLEVLSRGGIDVRHGKKDRGRATAVSYGLDKLIQALPNHGDPWLVSETRLDAHLAQVQEGYGRCMKSAFWQWHEHLKHGESLQPARTKPCNEPGHEQCCWEHVQRDLDKWSDHFSTHYGTSRVTILEFGAPRTEPRALRDAVTRFVARRPLAPLVGRTMGVLMARPEGWCYIVVVRTAALDLVEEAVACWREYFPDGSVREVPTTHPEAPRDIVAELRCQAEQAVFLLVAAGDITPERGRAWISETLGEDGAPAVRRLVFGPGFQTLPEEASDEFESSQSVLRLDANPAPWEACAICGDVDCRQRPVRPPLHFTEVNRMVAHGELVAVKREEGEVRGYLTVQGGPAFRSGAG